MRDMIKKQAQDLARDTASGKASGVVKALDKTSVWPSVRKKLLVEFFNNPELADYLCSLKINPLVKAINGLSVEFRALLDAVVTYYKPSTPSFVKEPTFLFEDLVSEYKQSLNSGRHLGVPVGKSVITTKRVAHSVRRIVRMIEMYNGFTVAYPTLCRVDYSSMLGVVAPNGVPRPSSGVARSLAMGGVVFSLPVSAIVGEKQQPRAYDLSIDKDAISLRVFGKKIDPATYLEPGDILLVNENEYIVDNTVSHIINNSQPITNPVTAVFPFYRDRLRKTFTPIDLPVLSSKYSLKDINKIGVVIKEIYEALYSVVPLNLTAEDRRVFNYFDIDYTAQTGPYMVDSLAINDIPFKRRTIDAYIRMCRLCEEYGFFSIKEQLVASSASQLSNLEPVSTKQVLEAGASLGAMSMYKDSY